MPSPSKYGLLILAFVLAGCSLLGGDTPPEADEAFDVRLEPHFDTRPGAAHTFEATVNAVQKGTARASVVLHDLSRGDTNRTLSFPTDVLTIETLPLTENRRYRFALAFRHYIFGSAPVLEVRDDDGLVFFGVTAGERDSLMLPDGWSAQLRDGGFDTRDLYCDIRTAPQVLEIEHRGQRIRLAQGEQERLGDYRVRALVARRVDYSDVSCTDVFAPTMSLMIKRATS